MDSNAIQSATNIVSANLSANWATAGTNYIGTDPYSIPGRNFDGCIDDVAFFNYSLSQAQLQSIFAAAYPSPVFSLQPLSQVVFPGQPASFTAAAGGGTPLYFKWRRNGTNLLDQGNISGSSTATLTITSVSPADTNNYDVVVTNSYGAVTSSVASLAFTPVPEILSQPVSLEVGAGQTAQLTVSATASVSLSYQWEAGAVGSGVFTNLSDGANISGSASPTLTITDSWEWNQADYIVVISDSAGQVISRVATLTVGIWEEAGQGGIVSAVAASPDGAWFASGSDDATVKLWRTSDGSVARTLTATGLHQVTSLAFGPPGTNLIAAGYYDGSIRLWNTTNGALVRTFTPCSGKVTSLAFSPTAAQLAVGSGDWITRILSLSSGAVLNNGGNGSVFNYGVVRSVAYSPDGSMLAVAGEDTNLVKTIFVLDGSSFYLNAALPQGLNIPPPASAPFSTPVSNSVTSLAFSPDGNTLASGCLDQTICLWSTATWALQRTVTNTGPGIISLAYAPNGQTLFAGDLGGVITPWVASTGLRAYSSWTAHTGPIWSLACSVDGSKLVSGGDDHAVQLWQTANGKWVTNLTSHSAMITKTCFAPDGSMIASAGNDASLRLWTAQTGAPAYVLAPHTGQVGAMAFSPDATFLVTGGGGLDNNICLWRSSNGAWLQTIPSLFTNGVTALAVSPDTSLIASAGDRYEQVIKLWHRSTGGLAGAFAGHTNGTAVLAFSPNGQYLASGGMFSSGTIKLWNMANGHCDFTFNGHNCTVVSISFNPTGTLLASAGQTDGLINIWTNGSVTPLLSLTLSAGARAVAFSPDGTLLVAGGSDSIQMWQTSNWQPVWTCTTETVGISALNFSPNGAFLVYGREDGTVGRMWNPQAAPVQLWLGATQPGRFTIANPSYSPFLTVQTSSDLAQWNTLTNLVVATNVVQVADPSPPPVRFYRVSTPQ
jgi:WD40 repeat protein